MEKFAVDLEKVLDEFEYNEEREENVSVPSIRNPVLPALGIGTLRQVPVGRPPAASYRRPSFEPINLADADFAASPPKPSSLSFSFGPSVPRKQNAGEAFDYVGDNAQLNSSINYVNTENKEVSALNNGSKLIDQLISDQRSETSEVRPKPQSSNDEKPDLLEYNSKIIDFSINKLDISNQLPDITTSVRSLDHEITIKNEEEKVPSSLDLISSTSGHHVIENGDITQNSNHYESDESESISQEGIKSNNDSLTHCSSLVQSNEYIAHLDNTWKSSEEEEDTNSVALDCNDSKNIGTYDSSLPLRSNLQTVKNVCDTAELNGCVQLNTEVKNDAVLSSYQNKYFTTEEIVSRDIVADNEDMSDSKSFALESVQPIGFTTDSNVSEGELEEYLKELEEMEETVGLRNDFMPESNFIADSNNKENNTNLGEKNVTTKIDSSLSVYSNTTESSSDEKITERDVKNAQSSNISSEYVKDERMPSEGNAEDVSVKCESPISEDFDTSTSSTPLISENESVSENVSLKSDQVHEETSNIDGSAIKLDKSSVGVERVDVYSIVKKDNVEIIKTNQQSNTNPFENSEFKTEEDKKGVISTNPFEEEDSGYASEKMESKRKSTNPFDEDDVKDKDISQNCTVPEAQAPSRLGILNENLTLTKTRNKKSKKDKLIKENLKDDSESSTAVVSSDDKPNDKREVVLAQTEDKSLPANENVNTTKLESPSEQYPVESSLPSTSGSVHESVTNTLDSSTRMIPIKAATEATSAEHIDEAGVVAEEDRPLRPNSLELPKKITVDSNVPQSPPPQSPPQSPPITGQLAREFGPEDRRLGKIPPFWVPDTDAVSCMQCQQKFTVIKRRHHCRACGQVLCYKCCGLKARLEYMNFTEARVCQPCFTILEALNASEVSSPLGRQPNPNNPMEYCSTIPPLQQAAGSLHQPPPSVMVPVGVLKREGRSKSDVTKQVMFSDGIRPGGDLTELDGSCEPRMPFRRPGRLTKRVGTPPGGVVSPSMRRVMDPSTHSFIPAEGDTSLPPLVSRVQGEVTFSDLETPIALNQPNVKFAINRNLFVIVKRVMLDCCVNRECWCFSTEGLSCVGQDEIVFLLECLAQETQPPKDIFLLINYLYQEAAKGATVSEMSFTPATSNNLLGSRDHGGFLYIRTSYQCLTQLVLPSPPYLVALLIHRWETPWARLFPLRLVLRLGAEFRYYPCPLVSVRNRPPLYTDIGHTIINLLADFRKYSYTLPSVRGLVIHMEDRQTTINIPRNRYDQVVRALNNSNDSVLAFGANLSLAADSHLVCMQSTMEDDNTAYTTQAINIHNKPRRVTGASFVVFNGALKVPGLAGKSSIVEDGLMVQVPSETMTALRAALRDMRDYSVGCGPGGEENVALVWTADDTNFNIGVKSCIDGRALDGVPSIRVHNGTDYSGGTRIIRWTEVFILQCDDSEHSSEPLDISRLSESIARATCLALVPLLDLLSAASLSTLAVRTTIHPDNVGYEAGSNGEKLPPLYMKSLDDELIAVVHQAALASQDNPCVLELVFRIMEQG